MFKFSCTYQNYNGYLHVSPQGCTFTSSLFRVELKWCNVKKIKLDTKQIKGIPTSVLVIGLTRSVMADDDNGTATSNSRKRKNKNGSKKYIFYGFPDLLGAEEKVKTSWERWKREAAAAASDLEKRDSEGGADSADDNDSTAAHRAHEVESGSSTHAEADISSRSSPAPLIASKSGVATSDIRLGTTTSSAAKRAALLPVHRRVGVDVLTPQRESSVGKLAERVLVESARVFTAVLHRLLKGGFLKALALGFLICLVIVTVNQMHSSFASLLIPSSGGKYKETKNLLNSLQRVYEYHKVLDQYVSLDDYYRANRRRQAWIDGSPVWVRRLEASAMELAESYVLIQAEMLNLRGRRAERLLAAEVGLTSSTAEAWRRLFQEGDRRQRRYYLAAPSATTSELQFLHDGDDDEGARSGVARRARTFSIRRVAEDLDYWRRIVVKTASWIHYLIILGGRGGAGRTAGDGHGRSRTSEFLRFFSSGRSTRDGATPLVRYAEPFLDGYNIVQYVAPEEQAERQACLRITEELVRMSNLIEDVFFGFTTFLMADSYERIASGVEKPHFWGSTPPLTSVLSASGRGYADMKGLPFFTSDQVLRVLFIRRYMKALLHLDPLEPDEYRRRANALALSQRLQDFSQREVELSQHMNRTNKDVLLELFSEVVLPRHFTGAAPDASSSSGEMASTLRNILEEARFWSAHEELWMEHLHNSLPQSHRDKLQKLAKLYDKHQTVHRKSDRGASSQRSDRAKQDACALGSSSSIEELANCQRQLHWEHLPTFKGLLCFTPQPRLRRASEQGGGVQQPNTAKKTGSKRKREAQTTDFVKRARSTTHDQSSPTHSDPTNGEAFTSTQTGQPSPQSSASADPAGTVGPLNNSSGGTEASTWDAVESSIENSEDDLARERVANPALRVRSPYASRYSKPITAEEEFRRLFDPTRLENAVSQSKERWMGDLHLFLSALGHEKRGSTHGRHTRRRTRSFRLEHEEESVDPQLSASRARLLALIDKLNYLYLHPIISNGSRSVRFVEKWLWPPSWLRFFFFGRRTRPELDSIRETATADPAVQLASAQIVQIPWGTDKDAPLILLKNVLLQPPELLKLRIALRNQLAFSWALFVIAIVVIFAVITFS